MKFLKGREREIDKVLPSTGVLPKCLLGNKARGQNFGARNPIQISHMSGRNQPLEPSSLFLRVCTSKSWS